MATSPLRSQLGFDDFLAAHRRWFLGGLLVAAVAVRVTYYVQISDGPLLHQHLAHDTDMNFFHAWAGSIAAGDWLTDRSLHPHHYWHEQVAQAWLRRHPEAAGGQSTEPGPDGSSPAARAIWDRWWGEKRFHQEPLYAYLVGATYAMFGADVRWVFAWQAILGVCNVLLIVRLSRRLFGESAGVAAGLLAVLCGPLVLYDLTLLRTTAAVFATLVLIELGDAALQRGEWRRWLAVGLASGLLVLLEMKFVLLGMGVAALSAWRQRREIRARWPAAIAFVGGTAAALAPLVARNAIVGAPLLSLSSVGAASFACANTGGASAIPVFTLDMQKVAEIMGRTDGRMGGVLVETLRTHSGLASYLGLIGGKLGNVWHWYEGPNNVNLYYAQLHAGVLRVTLASFAFIAPPALVGLLLAAWRRRLSGATVMALLASLAPLLLFSVLARYRAPLVAVCIPLAALTVASLARWLAERRFAAALAIGAAVAAAAAWTGRPLQPGEQLIYPFDYITPYQYFWGPREQEAAERGEWARSAEILRSSLHFAPRLVAELGAARPARNESEMTLAGVYLRVFERWSLALRNAGRPAAAEDAARRVTEIRAALPR